ncbi:MAG: MerR family transcriptional regulator [Bacteroidales bacterium]|nr:MerR family transcriptional regulator [Bacteroidales bacterium]
MNEHKIKFKIGEFSKLNMVTIKTLRHYEEIGLLVPDEIDQWTGYRYYRVDQLNKMNQIIFLKKLGFSLEEIREVFDEENQTPDIDQIQSKIEQCKQEMQKLQWRQTELSRLESTLHKKKIMEQVIIKSLPAVIVASHRRVITSYQELFNLCPNVIGPEMARLGCICAKPEYAYTIDHNKEYSDTNIDLEYCEAVVEKRKNSDLIQFKNVAAVKTAICANHCGVYDTFPQTFARLYEYIEQNGFRIVDNPRFCYIDGIWNKESEEEWLTEIQVPVEKE